MFLHQLAHHLGDDQPLYAYQSEGLDSECRPLETMPAMAERYVSELQSVQPSGPYILYGHCAGARLAHAMAAGMEDAGETVSVLIVLDARPPNVQRPFTIARSRKAKLQRGLRNLMTGRWVVLWQSTVRNGKRKLGESWALRLGSLEARKRVHLDRVNRACVLADDAYRGTAIRAPVVLLRCPDRTDRDPDWSGFAASVTEVPLDVPYLDAFFEPHVAAMARTLEEVARSAIKATPLDAAAGRPQDATPVSAAEAYIPEEADSPRPIRKI